MIFRTRRGAGRFQAQMICQDKAAAQAAFRTKRSSICQDKARRRRRLSKHFGQAFIMFVVYLDALIQQLFQDVDSMLIC